MEMTMHSQVLTRLRQLCREHHVERPDAPVISLLVSRDGAEVLDARAMRRRLLQEAVRQGARR